MGRFFRARGFWTGLSVAALGLTLCGGSARDYFLRWRERRRVAVSVADARLRVMKKERIAGRSAQDPEFMEAAVRRSLGRLRPGEIEFRFPKDPDESPAAR